MTAKAIAIIQNTTDLKCGTKYVEWKDGDGITKAE